MAITKSAVADLLTKHLPGSIEEDDLNDRLLDDIAVRLEALKSAMEADADWEAKERADRRSKDFSTAAQHARQMVREADAFGGFPALEIEKLLALATLADHAKSLISKRPTDVKRDPILSLYRLFGGLTFPFRAASIGAKAPLIAIIADSLRMIGGKPMTLEAVAKHLQRAQSRQKAAS